MQAQRQDSGTGGGRNKFWGAWEVHLCEFGRGTGAREIYPSLDQTNKVKTKKKRSSLKFRGIFRPKSEIQTFFPAKNSWPPKKKGLYWNSEGFFDQNQKFKRFFRPKIGDLQKKRSSPQKFCKIRCKFTKITIMRVPNTNFGLDLHSSSPDPVNFFGAQSSLGGAQAVIWGARPLNALRGAGHAVML